jgi:4-amino-4-deoxy-L-arabinose transferase-like glycosyltransferase
MTEEKGSVLESHINPSRPLRFLIVLIPVLLLFVVLLYLHIKAINMPEEYVGFLSTVDRVFDLSLVLAITGIAFCTGRTACRLLKIDFDNIAEEISFSVMLGIGAIGLGILLIGLVGLLSLIPVTLLLLLFIGVSYTEVPRLLSALKQLFLAATRNRWRIVLSLLFFLIVINLFLRAATPVHSFDEAIYHLSVTKRFADQHQIYAVPDNWAGNGPFLIQMIYAVCLIAKTDIAAKFFSLLLALLCSLSLYGFGRRFFSHQVGIIAMFAFWGAGMVVEVAVTARTDVSLAFILFLATYAMMAYFESAKTGWLYTSAILSGFALGVKYTAGIWILLLAVLYLVESFIRKSTDALTILKRGIVYTAIAAALASPWFIKNAVWFHNPIYPFVTGEVAEFKSPGTRFFNAEDEAKLEVIYEAARATDPGLAVLRKQQLERSAGERIERYPLKVWEYFTMPDIYNMAEENHYPNYLFLISPLILLFFKRRWLMWLAAFSVIFFLAVTSTSWVGRILLPVYPALTIICSFLLSELIEWGKKNGLQKFWIPILALLTISIVTTIVGYSGYLSFKQAQKEQAFDFISGNISRRNFMLSQFYYPPLDYINHQLPKDARVMMVGAQMSYGLERDYIAEVNWDSTDWRRLLVRSQSFEDVSQDLKRQGITHILFTDSLFKWVALMGRDNYPNVSGPLPQTGPDYQTQLRNWTTMDIFSRNFLESVYTDQMGYILYKVK